jgi:hypothetical protein
MPEITVNGVLSDAEFNRLTDLKNKAGRDASGLTVIILNLEKQIQENRLAMARAESAVAAQSDQEYQVTSEDDIAAIDAQIREIFIEGTGLANALEVATKAEAQSEARATAETRRDEVTEAHKEVGSILTVISEKRRELLSGSIGKPLDIANQLAKGILKGPLVFEEGDIGMKVGDRFVSSKLFSGTETAVVMMGLTIGLSAKSSVRIAILDEIGRLDADNIWQLAENLDGMIKDKLIDQAILIGPVQPDLLEMEGLNVIRT